MATQIRPADGDDLGPIARLIADCQADPTYHVAYPGFDVDSITTDIAELEEWTSTAVVEAACHDLFAAGATYVHLSVREHNRAARALYGRLGFIEERLARPYRRGFRLP